MRLLPLFPKRRKDTTSRFNGTLDCGRARGVQYTAESRDLAGDLTMNAVVGSDWLDRHVLPDIQGMLVQDAYFKLMGHARELTGKFNGAIAGFIYIGYVTSQTIAIRRLCENKRDVISLCRVLEESKNSQALANQNADYLFAETGLLSKHNRPREQLHRAPQKSCSQAEYASVALA